MTKTGSWVPRGHFIIEINPGWLELPLAGTYFHGSRPVGATEVPLYTNELKSFFVYFEYQFAET